MEQNVASIMTVLTGELEKDPSYRIGWQANIAMAFFDECRRHPAWSQGRVMTHDELHTIANKAADNFLKTLCYRAEKTPEEIRDRQELLESFEGWFQKMLFQHGSTCLERDVLRNLKRVLREEWVNCSPTWTTTELEKAEKDAKELRKRLVPDADTNGAS